MSTERIEFLCPSGHTLHGPITLAGRAGQCPHCGMRFRIPSLEELQAAAQDTGLEEVAYEEAPAEEELEEGAATEEYAEEVAEEEIVEEQVEEYVDEEYVEEFVEEFVEEAPETTNLGFFDGPAEAGEATAEYVAIYQEEAPAAAAADPHAMATLFAELWRHKADGAVVELHLGNNETVHAEHYSPSLSKRSLGVFAVRDAGGSYTLTAIAWDLITRVSVRGVKELPEGLFE